MIGHDAGNLVFVLSAAVDTLALCAAVAWAVRGVGAERGQAPRIRLGAVPEVSLITLR